MFNDIQFANPEFFWGFILIALLIVYRIFFSSKKQPAVKFSDTSQFKVNKNWKVRLREIPLFLRVVALSLILIVLARPQTSSTEETRSTEGIDIVMALDISSSMKAEDFKPNRIEAAKRTALEFIEQRPNDRIGLVVFAGQSFTQCPVTIDHDILKQLLSEIETGMVKDGTAIGMGLATSVSRLKDLESKSKVVILLTDGENNAGSVSPGTAAEIAKTFGIRVYTIGVGTTGKAPITVKDRFGRSRKIMQEVKIDEELLNKISDITEGEYFRAKNNDALKDIYSRIDEMEKIEVDISYFSNYTEEFLPFAIAAGVLLLLDFLLRISIFRKLP